jgi:signal transduction histidine kinase
VVAEAMDRQAQFAANASHEFCTPLAIMRTILDCLQAEKDIQASPQYNQSISGLQEEVERFQLRSCSTPCVAGCNGFADEKHISL